MGAVAEVQTSTHGRFYADPLSQLSMTDDDSAWQQREMFTWTWWALQSAGREASLTAVWFSEQQGEAMLQKTPAGTKVLESPG